MAIDPALNPEVLTSHAVVATLGPSMNARLAQIDMVLARIEGLANSHESKRQAS